MLSPTTHLDCALGAAARQDRNGAAGRRIALVVGNGNYGLSPLVNPANDAELISKTLEELGFEVRPQKNGDQKGMKRAIQEFGAALDKAGSDSVGLFYYAGHGVQLNGRNYLVPVDANIERDADMEIEAVAADWVLEQMRYARNRLNFVILDACRNNPFARSFRSADRGLAKMDAPAGVLIAYSTAPGDVAADGAGSNSPYTEALAHSMRESDGPAELMFKQVRDTVRRVTSERQTPWESSSLTGENFYFATLKRSPDSTRVTSAPAAATVQTPVADSSVATPTFSTPSPAPNSPSPVSKTEDFANSAPRFMRDGLCARAVGEWRIEDDAKPGIVNLDAQATGVAKLDDTPKPVRVTWRCDAVNRGFVITYDNNTVHKTTMDDSEKLLFGYDQHGTAVVYTR